MLEPTTSACRAASQLGRTVNLALEDAQLSPAGYRLLAYLSSGPAAATVLADKLAVSRPSVTATIDSLEERGQVTRSPDPVDGRRVSVQITTSGAAALAEADGLVAARLRMVLEPAGDAEGARILKALDGLYELLHVHRTRRHEQRAREAAGS